MILARLSLYIKNPKAISYILNVFWEWVGWVGWGRGGWGYEGGFTGVKLGRYLEGEIGRFMLSFVLR